MKRFPFYQQLDAMDCGPTCLRMVAKHYGKTYSLQYLRKRSYFTREGVSLLGISEAAEAIGFRTLMAKIPFQKLKEEASPPFIAHWRQRHFVVVYNFKKDYVYVADPSHGLIRYAKQEFLDGWLLGQPREAEAGVVLLLETTPQFYVTDDENPAHTSRLNFVLAYLYPYRRFLVQLFLGMLVGSLLQLLFPLLTQSIVDIGINTQNIGFINLILIGQLMLFFSRTAVEMIRSWILLHIGTRINISILSDFLIKLMKLPLGFFDTKMIGDLLQRIDDHKRIEVFLTSSTLSIAFSFVNIIVFGFILAYYSFTIFSIFLLGSVCYTAWIVLFLKHQKSLDYKLFDQMAANQSNLIQLITGMQEIKLHNCERQKRWEWERIQARVFKINMKTLALNQYQQSGSFFINEAKNIFITYLAAKAVIDGEITLGMMLAVQAIIGQLNAPINEMISFIRTFQDAQISMERLGEIHQRKNEDDEHEHKVILFPEDGSLSLHNVSFRYEGLYSQNVLYPISLTIPQGKVTAIVGASGSGKTTLIKLLLKFYEPTQGEIRLGGMRLSNFSNHHWRKRCGAVMQDGYLFADTIARNIAVGIDEVDRERLLYAVKVANIQEYIESLALNYNTKIGSDGHGLSQGQRQRILIARAVYKNPDYIFLDEATNALDASNERIIMENLDRFLEGKTVVIVAHRLSTVVKADQIIVLDKGQIIEQGTHTELAAQRGAYFQLVKNQLELGA